LEVCLGRDGERSSRRHRSLERSMPVHRATKFLRAGPKERTCACCRKRTQSGYGCKISITISRGRWEGSCRGHRREQKGRRRVKCRYRAEPVQTGMSRGGSGGEALKENMSRYIRSALRCRCMRSVHRGIEWDDLGFPYHGFLR